MNKPSHQKAISSRAASPQSLSLQRNLPSGCAGLLFGLLITATFGAAAWFFALEPFVQWRAVQSWQATPCMILQSAVVPEMSGKRRLNYTITYSYRADGRQQQSTRYNVFSERMMLLYSRHEMWRLEKQIQPGSRATCFVNPQDATQAVLSRAMPPSFRVAALVICLPALLGVLLLLVAFASLLRGRR